MKAIRRSDMRIMGDERILGSSEFVEATLKQANEAYDRGVRLQSAGIDLSWVVAAVCRHSGVDEKELAGPARRADVARARALIGYIATRKLWVPGSCVARKLKMDRSAVSRGARRVEKDVELTAAADTILKRVDC